MPCLTFLKSFVSFGFAKSPKLSEDNEFYLALRRNLAGLTAEADFPAPRGTVADDEFLESGQHEAKLVLRQMLNQRVFQTGDEDFFQTYPTSFGVGV
jgi:hypothetical protein